MFTGRGRDTETCAHFLADPQTRILLLHGQTGCGKSSFLRAALIPSLEESEYAYLFLRVYANDADQAGSPAFIRCGSDPVSRIAEAIYTFSLRFVEIDSAVGKRPVDLTAARLEHDNMRDFVEDCRQPGRLIKALHEISQKLSLTLIIILDQAEEVITLEQPGTNCSRQFFRFLKEFTLHNFPIKFVLALRKDYSGQFIGLAQLGSSIRLPDDPVEPVQSRDPLVKSDIKIFFLAELNTEDVVNAIELPTSTQPIEGNDVDIAPPFLKYRFTYAPGVAKRIATDLKAASSTAILPVMQIVCRDLFDVVNKKATDRQIDGDLYDTRQRITGPVDRHISNSLRKCFDSTLTAVALALKEDRGRALLAKLVQQQSDGSVHSRQVSLARMRQLAKDVGLESDVDRIVDYLSRDDVLLLRSYSVPSLDEADDRKMLSLGHDVIGVVLRDWQLKRDEAERRKAAEERTRRTKLYASLATVFIGVLAAVIVYFIEQARQQGANEMKLDILLAAAESQKSIDPLEAMSIAALAVDVAKKDLRPAKIVAEIAAALPETVIRPTVANVPIRFSGFVANVFPLRRAAGFLRVEDGTATVMRNVGHGMQEQKFDLKVDPSGAGDVSSLMVSELATGDILLLRSRRMPNYEMRTTLFLLPHDRPEASALDGSYFFSAAGLPPTQKNNAGYSTASDIVQLLLSGEVVALFSPSSGTHLDLHLFKLTAAADGEAPALDLGKRFSHFGPVRLPKKEHLVLLAGYLITAQSDNFFSPKPSPTFSVTNLSDVSADTKQLPLPKSALEECGRRAPHGGACLWRPIYPRTNSTLLTIAMEVDPALPPEVFLFLDPATGQFLEVDLAGVRDQCLTPPKTAARTNAPPPMFNLEFQSFGTLDSLHLGFRAGSSLELIRVVNHSGKDKAQCGGRLYFSDDVLDWTLAADNQTLLATGESTALFWKSTAGLQPAIDALINTMSSKSALALACSKGPANRDVIARIHEDLPFLKGWVQLTCPDH